MRISDRDKLRLALAATLLFGVAVAGPAFAQDAESIALEQSSPWDAFKFGHHAYKEGDTKTALEAYRYAADQGLPGARWKLARMYATGDGVEKNDLLAFQMFSDIVNAGVAAGSQEESYLADAYVALANYFRTGISGTTIDPNPALARDLYMRAATAFGSADAQFELGRMILETNDRENGARQAIRWLKLAMKEGHAGAEALVGDLYFQRGRMVRGLALLTSALRKATPDQRGWIQARHEHAFSLANEADRRTALGLVESGGLGQ